MDTKRKKTLAITAVLMAALLLNAAAMAIDGKQAQPFVGQDLHLNANQFTSYQLNTGEHILVLKDNVKMSVGANQFSSEQAVVWLESVTNEFRGKVSVDYKANVYLEGNISTKKNRAARTTDLFEVIVEENKIVVLQFDVSGEVFVTADERKIADVRQLQIYEEAFATISDIETGPVFVVQPGAVVPKTAAEKQKEVQMAKAKTADKKFVLKKKDGKYYAVEKAAAKKTTAPRKPGLFSKIFAPKSKAKKQQMATMPQPKKPKFRYPINIAPVGEVAPKIEAAQMADQTNIATVIGRFYLWQKTNEQGGLLELQADNAVLFYSNNKSQEDGGFGGNPIGAIYLSGDVVMTEGQRTIRSDEMYYDFQRKKALAINVVMRSYDAQREIPIYVRAAKLRQLEENKFAADNIVLTSSEFYQPQISMTASNVTITDTTTVDAQMKKLSNSSFDIQMSDIRLKAGKRTVFYWPFMRSNIVIPDIPIKSLRTGHDGRLGTLFESRWYLSRLLGLKEPEGTDSTLMADYYSKRGFGGGAEIIYEKENYFGRLLGYAIKDKGEDRLGRDSTRKNIKHSEEIRGRFSWQHRQFLPYNWQLTTAVNYESDEDFLESFYRGEFDSGENRETYVHLKRIEKNWALSILGKTRINNFADQLEETPSIEYHRTGQSIFNDRFTLYSDTKVGRMQQKIGNNHPVTINEENFSFGSHRTEIDMPFNSGNWKIVPFAAGTFGYDDRSGFRRTLVNGNNTGSFGEEKVWIGELGVRLATQFWNTYPDVKSQLWDLNGLRHIIKPQMTTVIYQESDSVVEQRDMFNLGIYQRLQTKRGPAGKQKTASGEQSRTVDWMTLDADLVCVSNPDDNVSVTGPDRFIWNRPMVPLRVLSTPEIFNGDMAGGKGLQRFEMFGPRRNYFSADYMWRLSDTFTILSDGYFDIKSGVVQQFNIGLTHMRWPDFEFYIGSRYLKRVQVMDEKGSNAFVFAMTYIIDPRYRIMFSQQFDFDYGESVRSEITLTRRYHRVICGITLSTDQSLDSQAVTFNIWPQGMSQGGSGR